MTIRLINAKAVGDDLAAGRITEKDQSLYLTASFLIWLIPGYLLFFPAPRTSDPQFLWWISFTELALLALFCVVGVGFCLRRCRVEPKRHFLTDFSCLNAPISLTTQLIVWATFYIVTGAYWLLIGPTAGQDVSGVYEVLRMLASTAAVLLVFLRIGRHMNRVSLLRSEPAAPHNARKGPIAGV